MKSAIEENDLDILVCRWWEFAGADILKWRSVISWLYGAGAAHPDEQTCDEMLFLSHVLYEKRMLP